MRKDSKINIELVIKIKKNLLSSLIKNKII